MHAMRTRNWSRNFTDYYRVILTTDEDDYYSQQKNKQKLLQSCKENYVLVFFELLTESIETMQENSIKIKDVLVINERIFSIVGVWPLTKAHTRVRFAMAAMYFAFHLTILYSDLFDVLGYFELLIDNLMQSLVITVTFITMFIFRYNKSLAKAIAIVRNEMVNGKFNNNDEMHSYYYYNNISSVFSKYMICSSITSLSLMYLGPMTQFIQLYKVHKDIPIKLKLGEGVNHGTLLITAFLNTRIASCSPIILMPDHGNISSPLVLPFPIKTFSDFTDIRVYLLFYLYEIPLPYAGLYHTNTTCFVVILILHVCGRLSVLSYRIRNISWKSVEHIESTIAEIVEEHLEIMRIEQDVQDALSIILLLDVGECTVRLAVVMYSLLEATNTSNVKNICTFLLYALVVFFILYSYCYAGEQLIQECNSLQDAYYCCNWLDIPSKYTKLLITCMIHGQRRLQVTAGGFFTLSLYSFTDIIKSCMAYISMLQTMMQ